MDVDREEGSGEACMWGRVTFLASFEQSGLGRSWRSFSVPPHFAVRKLRMGSSRARVVSG